jgi:hypothetical protein
LANIEKAIQKELNLLAKLEVFGPLVHTPKGVMQDHAKAMIFFCYHLYEGLKVEYLTIKYPLVLWQNLKERYDHQRFTILPQACYD